jgi:hypothetical protein
MVLLQRLLMSEQWREFMGGLFSAPSPPAVQGPPPKTKSQIEAEERQVLADKKAKEDELARSKGLRGGRSLLSAGQTGFENTEANKLA